MVLKLVLFCICRNNKWKRREENTKNETDLLKEQTKMAALQNVLSNNPCIGGILPNQVSTKTIRVHDVISKRFHTQLN